MTNSEVKTKRVKIPAHDEGAFEAYVAMPADTGKSNPKPVLIVIQEIFGINAEMREKCEEYARQGYIAVCPDLFWRIEPGIELVDSVDEQLQRAFELYQAYDFGLGMEDLETTLGYARNLDICNGKVGTIGYCLGGHLAFRFAASSDLDAAVAYYGVQIEEYLNELENVAEPLLLHIAGEDEFVNKEAQDKIIEAIEKYSNITAHRYEGQNHAFARGNGMHYNKEAADLANARTAEFFEKYLA